MMKNNMQVNVIDKKTNKLEYKNYINSLFDLYSSLLTEKQIEYFKYYYFLDYSLREIASIYNVSSNAIYDQITKIEEALEKYESLLHLKELNEKRLDVLEVMIDDVGKLEEIVRRINDEDLNRVFESINKDIKNMKELEEME